MTTHLIVFVTYRQALLSIVSSVFYSDNSLSV